jgi:aminoglycoside phosphotransferase (APT) family kinase protein
VHKNEVLTDADQVRRLVAAQFPGWAGLPVTPVAEFGTDHLLFRVGDELVARMPRIKDAIEQIETDRELLPRLAAHLPLPVPVTLAVGEPGEGYPWPWSVVAWLPGETPVDGNVDLDVAAAQLGTFTAALRDIEDTTGGQLKGGQSRGVPLANRDEITRAAIGELGDRIDTARVTAAWEDALSAPDWEGPPRWLHGDIQAGNLLVHERQLSAVIDFGAIGLGDPAVDAMPGWNLFDTRTRQIFRDAAGYDNATWRRGRGWALSTALIGLPYYWDTVPAFVAEGFRKIEAVLTDLEL